ncbi:MAG: BrnT family toxin [Boseongicola sp.]|nr:BrnT family toxin [Boseongicola sp.]
MTKSRFTWDEGKNLSNQRKHGLSFEVAARVFPDPLQLSRQDRIEDGEQRWQTMGQIDGWPLSWWLTPSRKMRSVDGPVEVIRIISARPVTRKERTR